MKIELLKNGNRVAVIDLNKIRIDTKDFKLSKYFVDGITILAGGKDPESDTWVSAPAKIKPGDKLFIHALYDVIKAEGYELPAEDRRKFLKKLTGE